MSVSVCICVFACPDDVFLLHTVYEVLSTVTHFYQFNAGNIPAEIFM
jgi:hypothetical protein